MVRYFENDERSGYPIPLWPSISTQVPPGLMERHKNTESIVLIYKEMRRMHIELGTAAHVAKQYEIAAANMDCAMHYNKELCDIVESAYDRLFCSPVNSNAIKLSTTDTRERFENVIKCQGLALRVVINEIFNLVSPSNPVGK